jgi:hypothetical protein
MEFVVAPAAALPSMLALLSGVGWELRAAEVPDPYDPEAALPLCTRDQGLVLVPSGATVSRSVRRVVLLHDGTLASSPAVEVADRIAVSGKADVAVLHQADVDSPREHGSLTTLRLADHGPYDWQEWRDEFLRRFCPVSPGVSVTVELLTGAPVEAVLGAVVSERADVVVGTWNGEPDGGPAQTLLGLMTRAPCPLLIVGPTAPAPAHGRA